MFERNRRAKEALTRENSLGSNGGGGGGTLQKVARQLGAPSKESNNVQFHID